MTTVGSSMATIALPAVGAIDKLGAPNLMAIDSAIELTKTLSRKPEFLFIKCVYQENHILSSFVNQNFVAFQKKFSSFTASKAAGLVSNLFINASPNRSSSQRTGNLLRSKNGQQCCGGI